MIIKHDVEELKHWRPHLNNLPHIAPRLRCTGIRTGTSVRAWVAAAWIIIAHVGGRAHGLAMDRLWWRRGRRRLDRCWRNRRGASTSHAAAAAADGATLHPPLMRNYRRRCRARQRCELVLRRATAGLLLWRWILRPPLPPPPVLIVRIAACGLCGRS